MVLLLLCLFTLQCPASAKSARTIHLGESEMEQIFVEPGFSTLLKFNSHPEPGLIGDQDGFKVEYMKNIVAIKPLALRGKTNLFIFTKDGQFSFQLIAAKGHHDNVVYVEPKVDRSLSQPPAGKMAVPVDDLLTKRIGKTAASKNARLCLESISIPVSHTTLLLKFSYQEEILKKPQVEPLIKPDPSWFSIQQGRKQIKVENIFIESKSVTPNANQVTGLITGLVLIRTSDIAKGQDLRLTVTSTSHDGKPGQTLQVAFSIESFGHRNAKPINDARSIDSPLPFGDK